MAVSVTLSDVAHRAGVSLATASRVLHGSRDRIVGEPYRQRVLDAAEALGYTPNAHAQAMARGANNLLGLIVHDISDPYFSTIADGVMRTAEDRGLIVLLATTHQDRSRELPYVATLRSQRVRAIIVIGSRWDDPDHRERMGREIRAFTASGGRIAFVSQNLYDTNTVLPRNRAGAKALARELARMGHRRFVILGGPPKLLTARDRTRGFSEGLRTESLPKDAARVVHGAFNRDGGYTAAAELACNGLDATCVFAVNDVMAVGAMAAFRDHGVRVPDDVSVAGFDDIATLRDVAPSLTTVRLPLREMGERAAELALDEVSGAPRVVDVDGEVIIRASTRPLPG